MQFFLYKFIHARLVNVGSHEDFMKHSLVVTLNRYATQLVVKEQFCAHSVRFVRYSGLTFVFPATPQVRFTLAVSYEKH